MFDENANDIKFFFGRTAYSKVFIHRNKFKNFLTILSYSSGSVFFEGRFVFAIFSHNIIARLRAKFWIDKDEVALNKIRLHRLALDF